jgi:uroporphyrinogen decarboxylase
MTDEQWYFLTDFVQGKPVPNSLTGFIIDSPWIPGFSGISTLDYFSSDQLWFEANKKTIDTFPDIIFLPGFWSEFGMCTEPSAFGSKCIWRRNDLPHADKIINNISMIGEIHSPDPETDGLLPFVIQRLRLNQSRIKKAGHEIRFAISRGPLNIASFLTGTTELMMNMAMHPEEIQHLLDIISDFICKWLLFQKVSFPSIEGIFILDDLVGFIGEEDFKTFALPALQKIYGAFESKVRFFHNDAQGLICSKYLNRIGINLFNFSFEHPVDEIQTLAGPGVKLVGNLPPRDVLADSDTELVKKETERMYHSVTLKKNMIWSCGGGLPPGVPVENLLAFSGKIKELATSNL